MMRFVARAMPEEDDVARGNGTYGAIVLSMALAVAGCASGGVTTADESPSASVPSEPGWTRPATPLTPHTAGWEQFFTVRWDTTARGGRPTVEGRVRNEWGFPANQIQLLVDALDANGRVVAQRVTWLGADLPPGVAAPFSVPAPPAAAYRVSVYAFNWIQSGGGGDMR